LRAANTLADEFTLEVMDLAEPATKPVERLLSVELAQPMTEHHYREVSGALTAREADVLRGLAAGKTNAQIAVSLVVTEGTIKTHVKHILRKLGATNRTEAVARYHRMRNSSRDVSQTAGFRP